MDRFLKQIQSGSSESSKRIRIAKSHELKIHNATKGNFKALVHRLTSRVDQPHPSLPSLPSPPTLLLSPPSPILLPYRPSLLSADWSKLSPLFPPLPPSQPPRLLPCVEEKESLDASVVVHVDNSVNQNVCNEELFESAPTLPPIKTSLFQQEENIPLPDGADAPSRSLGCPNAPADLDFDPSMLSHQQEENIPLPVQANEPSLLLSSNFLPSISRIEEWLNCPDNLPFQPLQPDQQEENNIPPPVPTDVPSMNTDGTYVLPSPFDIQSSLLDLNSWEDIHSATMQQSPNSPHSPSRNLDWTNFQDGLHTPSMVLSSSFSSPSRVLSWPDSSEDLNSPTMLPSPDVLPSSPTTGLATRN